MSAFAQETIVLNCLDSDESGYIYIFELGSELAETDFYVFGLNMAGTTTIPITWSETKIVLGYGARGGESFRRTEIDRRTLSFVNEISVGEEYSRDSGFCTMERVSRKF